VRLAAIFMPLITLAGCGGAESSADPHADGHGAPLTPPTPAAAVRAAGSVQVSGAVEGTDLAFVDAVVVSGRHGARVVFVDRADYCEHPNLSHPATRTLTIDLGALDATSIEPGEYDVPEAFADASHALGAELDVVGPSCGGTMQFTGRPGSTTIDAATPTRIAGSFTLALGRDSIHGTFVATSCLATPPSEPSRCE
jgi:hypothetical protein